MKRPRAVVFDIYGTLFRIQPIPRTPEEWLREIGQSRETFWQKIDAEIARQHAGLKQRGIAYPEIQWPEVVAAVAPGLSPIFAAQFERRAVIQDGALPLLNWLREVRIPIALASNAQAYTLEELRECGIDPAWFAVRFLSFEQGYSKPDRGVFRWVSQAFAPIEPGDLLMVGDRLDNDILPAQAEGWRAWHVTAAGLNPLGDWLKSLEP